MKHISQFTAPLLKKVVSPELYYTTTLDGELGKSSGRGWYLWNGLCPFHDDTKPGSLYINKTTGAFWCFSCQVSGGDVKPPKYGPVLELVSSH